MVTKGGVPTTLDRIEHLVRRRPGTTRQDAAARLGLSTSAVTTAVSRLVAEGRLVESGPSSEQTGRGRPRTSLRVTGSPATVGVLLWARGLFVLAVVEYDGVIRASHRRVVPGLLSAEDVVDAARGLLSRSEGWELPDMLVFGIPAPFHQGVGLPLRPDAGDDVSRSFAHVFTADPFDALAKAVRVPVIVENDCNLAALGETTARHDAGRCVLYIKVDGEGVGSGLCIDGQIMAGGHGLGAEIAHLRTEDEPHVICSCGSRGCLDMQTGPRLLRQLSDAYEQDMTWPRLLELVDAGSAGPVRVLRDLGRQIARTTSNVCTFLDPSVILLEAGSPSATRALIEGFVDQLGHSTPPFIQSTTTVEPGKLADRGELLGAIELARQFHENPSLRS